MSFDEQPITQAPIEALSPPLYERFRTSRTRDEELDFLSKLGLVALDDQGQPHPSVAGILMACQDPRRWMPNAFIQAVAYHGTSLPAPGSGFPYQLDARDITGPLDEQVSEACRFVARNMKIASVTFGVGNRFIHRPQALIMMPIENWWWGLWSCG